MRTRQIIMGVTGGVAILAATAGFALASGGSDKQPGPYLDRGLSASQRDAIYQSQQAAFEQRYEAWLNSPVAGAAAQNPRALPQAELAADFKPGADSLGAAAAAADSIVAGNATKVTFEPHDTLVTFRVDRAVKGDPANSEITIVQDGGLRPTPDFQHAILGVSDAAPLLLPGDRAVLLLTHHDGQVTRFDVQSYSGLYRSENGKVKATPGNAFRGHVDGMAESQLLDQFATAASSH